MTKALEFLARMGCSAHMRGLSREALAEEMNAVGLSAALQQAVLRQDRTELVRLLKADGDVVCLIMLDKPEEIQATAENMPKAANA